MHDIALPHTVAHSVETLTKLNSEVLEHPPFSSDLAPSDYHLFGPLKQALRDRRIATDQQMKETAQAWLVSQPKNFHSQDVKKIVRRWTKFIEKQGGYVEK